MKKLIIVLFGLLLFTGLALGQTGVKKKRALPHEYGNVTINNYSEKAGLAPVEFKHWLHRSLYTCRLCHVDIAFGMKAGSTNIKAVDNRKGFYCGTCHNGKMLSNNKPIFASCSPQYTLDDAKRCERCHSVGRNVTGEYDFSTLTKKFPKERFGNGVDWDKAEADGLVKLTDLLEGVSVKRKAMVVQKDFALNAKVAGMPDIIFSHTKHTVWVGCELCHPEIFIGIKKGMTQYSMAEIYEGKYCGVCHIKVAFPLLDCQRCHTKAV